MAGVTTTAAQMLNLQRLAGNRAARSLIVGNQAPPAAAAPEALQRMVLLVSDDEVSKGNYDRLVEDQESDPSLRPSGDSDAPLAELGPDEAVHVVLHGVSAGQTAIGNATDVLGYLKTRGFDPNTHRGTIRLIVCDSGIPHDTTGESLASDLAGLLRADGFGNTVIGFMGLVQVRAGANIFVVDPSNEERFYQMKTEIEALEKKLHQCVAWITRLSSEWMELSDESMALLDEESELFEQEETAATSSDQERIEKRRAEIEQRQKEIAHQQAISTAKQKKLQLLTTRYQQQSVGLAGEVDKLWVPQSELNTVIEVAEVRTEQPASDMATIIDRFDDILARAQQLLDQLGRAPEGMSGFVAEAKSLLAEIQESLNT